MKKDIIEAIRTLGSENFTGLEVDVKDGVATLEGLADRRSTRDLALSLASRTPGVVEVKDELNYRADDSHLRVPTPVPDPRDNWIPESGPVPE
jgi:hypothetical protein